MPIWLLGSSLFSAQLAAVLGLPFVFASHFAPGDLLDGHRGVACAQGAIRILELQRAGKAPMKAEDFLRGTPLKPPLRFA